MKTTKRITEAQLRNIIHNVIMEEVQNQMEMNNLTEQELEEGLFGGMSSLFNRGKNMATKSSQNFGTNLKNKFGQGVEYAQQQYDKAKQNVQNAYGQAKKTYQAGSINQDLQKYVNNAESALTNLKNANQRALNSGFGALLNKNVLPLIDELLKNLNRVRGQGKSLQTNMQNADLHN